MKRVLLLGALAAFALGLSAGSAMAAGDAAKGKKVFNKCKACHSLEAGKNKVGPHLAGIVGRAAGAADGFKYSDAMMNAGIEWTAENLDAYLTKPKEFIAKNKMVFVGLKKPQQREDVIEFLKQAAQ